MPSSLATWNLVMKPEVDPVDVISRVCEVSVKEFTQPQPLSCATNYCQTQNNISHHTPNELTNFETVSCFHLVMICPFNSERNGNDLYRSSVCCCSVGLVSEAMAVPNAAWLVFFCLRTLSSNLIRNPLIIQLLLGLRLWLGSLGRHC